MTGGYLTIQDDSTSIAMSILLLQTRKLFHSRWDRWWRPGPLESHQFKLSNWLFQVFKIPLNGNGKTNLYWTIDYHKKLLHFEVHLPLPRISWFAIGFSDYGALNPADFCILWTDWKKRVHFEDAWTSENGRISVDESQDCTDFHYVTRGEMVKFGFYRKFTTCDPKDYEIEVRIW